MSDHPKEAERNLKRIRICDDIYLDVFRLLAPAKVGLELALVSDRFDQLVDTQFKSRKWTLGKLRIFSKDIVKMNDDRSARELPFPPKPLPNSIVGFARVNIFEIGSDVIAFLQCIGHLLETNVSLKLEINWKSKWNTFTASVWPLLKVSAIIKLHFDFPAIFQHFRRFTSPTILRDCTNLRMIIWDHGPFLLFPPDDSEGSSDVQAMCKWLLTPSADGQPKVLKCSSRVFFPMDALKSTFLNATTSVSFIIHLCSVLSAVGPFELVNSLTREQLTNRKIDDGWWLIERSPIDKCAEQWAKWEKEALEDGINDWKVLKMYS